VVKFLYVGRVGVEKNLAILAEAFLELRMTHKNAHLIVVGDGPYRQELERKLAGAPCTFTGFLEGDDLLTAFASADVKLFPSTTDTWGNAPLEAQASGLPVIVSDKGGPHELMVDGVTGYKVTVRDLGSLCEAMHKLMDGETRLVMGRNARQFTEDNRVDAPFSAILDSDNYRQRVKRLKKLPALAEADHGVTESVDDYLVDHRVIPTRAAGA
jgi:glycosyltransferase involved in cell wall biosynthesis